MKKRILPLILALVTTAAVFAAPAAAGDGNSPYRDVKTTRWSFSDIMYVTENGLMNGVGDGIFSPAGIMTRAMAVTVLWRMQGGPEVKYSSVFSDVKEGKWYTDAVIWASKNGVVNGVGGGRFAPADTVTREQLAAIIMRYASIEYIITDERADISGYADYGRIHSYARDAMAWAGAVGLINGMTKTTLSPGTGATREQFAAILRRFREYGLFRYRTVYNFPAYNAPEKADRELVRDADFYVSPDGNDGDPGTFDRPFATFERARDAVREYKASADGGIVVAFKGGDYGSLNIRFDASDSGTEECPVTYTAYGDGDVVFMNGVEIRAPELVPVDGSDYRLFPERTRSDIYKIYVGDVLTADAMKNAIVTLNGGMCRAAGYPNGGDNMTLATKYADNALQYLPFMKKKIESWHTLDGVTIEGPIMIDFEYNVFPALSWDSENSVMTFDTGGRPFPDDDASYWSGKPHHFCNVSEELDSRDEYYLDPGTMCLYVYGAEPDDVYSVAVGGQFISVGDGYADGAEWITFDGFSLRYCTETAMRISHASEHINVKNLDIYAVRGRGIHLNGEHNSVEGCSVDTFTGEGIYCFGGDLTVRSNLIRNGEAGIYAAGVREISHNEIENMTDSAVYYADCPVTIEYNVMRNVCLEGSDKGFIYNGASWFQVGGVIRYNLFCADRDNGGICVYLDDGLSNQEVYGNLFYGPASQGIRINGGRNNDVFDNVFIKGDGDSGTLLSLGAKYATMFDEDGNPTGSLATYHANSLGQKPEPGTAEYDLWAERWPEALAINTDWANVETDPDCGANASYNVVKNNYSFVGSENNAHSVDEPHFTRFSTVENNPIFGLDVNYLFVDPTHGDYRIRGGAGDGVITEIPFIPFEEMGRYN